MYVYYPTVWREIFADKILPTTIFPEKFQATCEGCCASPDLLMASLAAIIILVAWTSYSQCILLARVDGSTMRLTHT